MKRVGNVIRGIKRIQGLTTKARMSIFADDVTINF